MSAFLKRASVKVQSRRVVVDMGTCTLMTIAKRALPFGFLGFGNLRVRFLLKRMKWEAGSNRLGLPQSHIGYRNGLSAESVYCPGWTWRAAQIWFRRTVISSTLTGLFGCAWRQSESIRGVTRRVAKNGRGVSGSLCAAGRPCLYSSQPAQWQRVICFA